MTNVDLKLLMSAKNLGVRAVESLHLAENERDYWGTPVRGGGDKS